MAFPDRIERTVQLAHPPERVWRALTTAEGLGSWFGDDSATIDLRPGSAAQMRWTSGYRNDMRVERVEEPTVFAFTWQIKGLPGGDPRRTYVEFTLQPADGGTRLTVVETGFAQLPDDVFKDEYQGHVEGWQRELGELASYLPAA
ncbi:MAG TPA: SRPBCC domain-containing protein [Streptosporangiaceae bacterium]